MEKTNNNTQKGQKSKGQLATKIYRFQKNKLAMLGLILIGILLAICVFADFIADYDTEVIKQNVEDRLQPPSTEHLFGTDQYGRDVFARVVHGTRISVLGGVMTNVLAMIVGVILGALAGYYGKKVDSVIGFLCDVLMALPFAILAMAIVTALGTSLDKTIIALTVSSLAPFARLIRASVMSLKDQEFIEAARAYGSSDLHILGTHIVPNTIGPVIVQVTQNVGRNILCLASLSFIGLGVEKPMPEWGTMLSEAKTFMRFNPNLVFAPGIAIVIAVMAFNLVGDGLRDALDPRLKN